MREKRSGGEDKEQEMDGHGPDVSVSNRRFQKNFEEKI